MMRGGINPRNAARIRIQRETSAWLKFAGNNVDADFSTLGFCLKERDVDAAHRFFTAVKPADASYGGGSAGQVMPVHAPLPVPVFVVPIDTLACAAGLLKTNPDARIGVLNMASAYSVGGGYLAGAGAQEEDLFRRTDVSVALERCRPLYPIGPTRMLVQPRVRILRGEAPDYAWLAPPYKKVTMLTAAAVRKPTLDASHTRFAPPDEALMRTKIELLLVTAATCKCDMLVLGAWGCGAYGCPPGHVAELFRDALATHGGAFKRVVFAILNASYDVQDNYGTFKAVFAP
jgi:uncharacterized protein (TIGR02452 family)